MQRFEQQDLETHETGCDRDERINRNITWLYILHAAIAAAAGICTVAGTFFLGLSPGWAGGLGVTVGALTAYYFFAWNQEEFRIKEKG